MNGLRAILERLVRAAVTVAAPGPKGELRRFLKGVLWILRTGAPWRDLPQVYGHWNSVFRRFRRWTLSGRWMRLVEQVRRTHGPDEVVLIDSTVVHAHPDAAGARSRDVEREALGRSRGGFTTKVHALVSARGRWVTFRLTPGQRGDITQAIPLLRASDTPPVVIGDRAYDSDALLSWLTIRGCRAVIPARRRRRVPRVLDRAMYAVRNVIERFFGRLKRLRRVGTRYDKTSDSFGAFVALGALAVERTAWA